MKKIRTVSHLKSNRKLDIFKTLNEALLAHQQGDLLKAESGYRLILDQDSEQPDALHYLGVLRYQSGQLDEAESMILRAINRHPLPVMYKNLASVYSSQKKDDQSVLMLLEGLALDPNSFDLSFALGIAYINLGQWPEALKIFEQLLVLDQSSLPVLLNLANCYKNTAQTQKAEQIYKQILREAPNMPEAHSNLGALYAETGRAEQGLKHHATAVQLRPDSEVFVYNLGNCYWAAGKLADALTMFEKAVSLNPRSIRSLMNYATALQIAGQLELALSVYRQAEVIDPNKGQIYVNVGSLCYDLKKYDEALVYLKKGLTLAPSSFNAWATLGEVYGALGRYDDAREALHKSLNMEPRNGLAWLFLASIEERSNRVEQAVLALKQALEKTEGVGLAASAADQRAEAALRLANLFATYADLTQSDYYYALANEGISEKHKSFKRCSSEPKGKKLIYFRPVGRSGSLFFHGLIDGHPQISTLPSVIMKGFFGATVWDGICPSFEETNWREVLLERFFTRYAVLLNANSPLPVPGNPFGRPTDVGEQSGLTTLGDNRTTVLRFNEAEFKQRLLQYLLPLSCISAPRFFEILHQVYDEALGWSGDKSVIFFHIHNPGPMELGASLLGFDDVQFLNIVRNPLQAVESWMKLSIDSALENPDSVLMSYTDAVTRFNETITAVSHFAHYRFPSIAVRLEDVKRRPDATFKQLTEWMGVEDHPSLRESTFAGLAYDAPASAPVKGFETSNLERKAGALFSEHDQRVMNLLLYPIAVQYGYREADPGYIEREIAWYKPLISEPLDFEKKLLAQLAAMGCQKDTTGPRRHFENIAQRCINLLEKFGTYPAMAPWLKVEDE